jgi:hypothetical protein
MKPEEYYLKSPGKLDGAKIVESCVCIPGLELQKAFDKGLISEGDQLIQLEDLSVVTVHVNKRVYLE